MGHPVRPDKVRYTGLVFGTPPVPATIPSQVAEDAYLLDVREPDEWAAGHAPGAFHLPMREIPMRMGEVPADREVVVVCRVGARSAQVVAYLMQQGWDRVANLDGGMHAWEAAGRPMVSENGNAARVL
jgi:rhodanese-related sulfurtransferase